MTDYKASKRLIGTQTELEALRYPVTRSGDNSWGTSGGTNRMTYNWGTLPSTGTIALWIYFNAYSGYMRWFTSNAGSNVDGIVCENNYVLWGSGSSYQGTVNFKSSGFDTDKWYHVAFTWNTGSGGQLKTYLDGTYQNAQTDFADNTHAMGATGGGLLGESNWTNRGTNGRMDNVTFYDIELSASQISDLANGVDPNTIATNDLQVFYNMEQTGSTLTNVASGSGAISADGGTSGTVTKSLSSWEKEITTGTNNLQANSIFENTTNGKHYIWSGSAWTEVV